MESKTNTNTDLNQQDQRVNQNQQVHQIQQNTTTNLEEILKLARETEKIGKDTMDTLNLQGEKLKHASNQMNDIDNDMIKAKKTIRNMEWHWYDPRTWF